MVQTVSLPWMNNPCVTLHKSKERFWGEKIITNTPLTPTSDVLYPTPTGCLFSWLVSTTHQDAMALFWTVSYVMNSAEGTDGKQYHECPIVNKEKNTDNLYQSSDFNSEACKTQPSHLPWDHLHLYIRTTITVEWFFILLVIVLAVQPIWPFVDAVLSLYIY